MIWHKWIHRFLIIDGTDIDGRKIDICFYDKHCERMLWSFRYDFSIKASVGLAYRIFPVAFLIVVVIMEIFR